METSQNLVPGVSSFPEDQAMQVCSWPVSLLGMLLQSLWMIWYFASCLFQHLGDGSFLYAQAYKRNFVLREFVNQDTSMFTTFPHS